MGLNRVETAVVGAAPVPPEVIEFFWAIGVLLCEGYGMSEILITTVNPIDAVRIGTVGRPVPGIQLRLAEDGPRPRLRLRHRVDLVIRFVGR